jgi:hypothetical protein
MRGNRRTSQNNIMNLALLIAALLLAIALFIAGVIWRGRVLRGDSTKPGSATGIPAALSQPLAFATGSPARQG